jgi:hypothetical protein
MIIRSVASACHNSRCARANASCELTAQRLAAYGFIHVGVSNKGLHACLPVAIVRRPIKRKENKRYRVHVFGVGRKKYSN